MQDIVVTQVFNNEGVFSHLELRQGEDMIRLSLGNTTLDSQPNSFKWDNLKPIIDTMQEGIRNKAEEDIANVAKLLKGSNE